MPRLETAEEILGAYLDQVLRGTAADPETFLSRYPGLDEGLRQRVRSLGQVLAKDDADSVQNSDLPFEQLADFRLIRRLGQGGMGVVYLAEQVSLGRPVALKLIRPDLTASETARARFQREAQAVAALRHPNVVAVHAAGEENGTAYLAMELLSGEGLDVVLKERTGSARPSPVEVVEWGRDLAEALSAAHAAGIVHRDVKPSNVRVVADGRALLTDFGLARRRESAALTQAGEFRGSPSYASPEQVSVNRGEIDARTDVYSLGATLYECLAGQVPFEGDTSEQVFQRILTEEPAPLRKLRPEIPADVETVVLKAMEKETGRRYQSAAAFADDLRAILQLRPIRARPAGAIEKTFKWVRRKPSLAASILLAFLLVVVGPILFGLQQRAAFKKAEASRLALHASAVLGENPALAMLLSLESLANVETSLGRSVLLETLAACHEKRTYLGHTDNVYSLAVHPDGKRMATGSWDGKARLWDIESGRVLQVYGDHEGRILKIVLTPDGEQLLTTGSDHFVRVWDLDTGKLLQKLAGHEDPVWEMAVTPDGRFVLSGAADSTVRVWSTADWSLSGVRDAGGIVHDLQVHPDNRRFLTASQGGGLRIWSLDQEEPLQVIDPGSFVEAGCFRPEREEVLGIHNGTGGVLWSLETGEPIRNLFETRAALKAAFNPDGSDLIAFDGMQQPKVWDVDSGKERFTLTGHSQQSSSAVFSPDGTRIATAARDDRIVIHDAQTGIQVAVLKGHAGTPYELVFLGGGERLLSSASDGTARQWMESSQRQYLMLNGGRSGMTKAEFTSNHAAVLSSSRDGIIRQFAADTGEQFRKITQSGEGLRSMAVSNDGRWLAAARRPESLVWTLPELAAGPRLTGETEHEPRLALGKRTSLIAHTVSETKFVVQDLKTDRTAASIETEVPTSWIQFGPEDRKVFHCGTDNEVRVYDAGSGGLLTLVKIPNGISGMAIHPNGRFLALGTFKASEVHYYDLDAGESLWVDDSHSSRARKIKFSPDGHWILVANADGKASIHAAASRNHAVILRGHQGGIRDCAWSPDGERVATASADGTIRIWDRESAQELMILRGHTDQVTSVSFHPDGMRLLSSSLDGTGRIWNLADAVKLAAASRPREFQPDELRQFGLGSP